MTTKSLPGQNCMNRARPVQTAHHKAPVTLSVSGHVRASPTRGRCIDSNRVRVVIAPLIRCTLYRTPYVSWSEVQTTLNPRALWQEAGPTLSADAPTREDPHTICLPHEFEVETTLNPRGIWQEAGATLSADAPTLPLSACCMNFQFRPSRLLV